MNTKELPTVEIILVDYDSYDETKECLESLENLSYCNCSVTVVNNGTETKNRDLHEASCLDINVIDTDENKGFAGANNVALREVRKKSLDYALLLNNDTVMQEDTLLNLILAIEDSDDIGIVGGEIRRYSDDSIWYAGGTIQEWLGRAKHYQTSKSGLKDVSFVTGCMMLVDTQIIDDIGLLADNYFMYYEDVEYCYRYLQNGGRISVVHEAKIRHKEGASSGETKVASPLRAYYDTRNRLIFSRNELPFPKNVSATMFNLITRMYVFLRWWILGGEETLRAGLRGLVDGLRNQKGKHPDYPNEER